METPRLGQTGHHILLALTGEERHGYGIMKQILLDTDGEVHLGPATLYTTLKRLLDQKLIEEAGEREDTALDDSRRRYYKLTTLGAQAIQDEAVRAQRFLKVVSQRCAA
jgi:DNA-binding PadR family transcriptional regulator